MSTLGRSQTLDVKIFPAGGAYEKIVRSALSLTSWGKRFKLESVSRLGGKPTPHLILIDVSSLNQGERALPKVIQELKQGAWKKVPVIVLDDPEADILYGYADGYAARVCLSVPPAQIAKVIESVIEDTLLSKA
jgi:DNA-binding NarL/FixJ family response regulator